VPLPKLRHCLVCEEARSESRNLLTLLGFFGVCPQVEIRVEKAGGLIPRLAFVFVGDKGTGEADVFLRLVDDQKSVVLQTPKIRLVFSDPDRGFNLSFNSAPFPLPRTGRYTVQVFIDEKPEFEADFNVAEGKLLPP
jgi:uncharacterized protein DUF6941